MTESNNIAIVGAGLTGSAIAVHLARRAPVGMRVVLFGAPGETARGLAYSTTTPEHLLNVRAGRMSLVPDDPGHFVRWLVDDAPGAVAGDPSEHYAPRMVYGRYVEDTLRAAMSAHPAITVVEETVRSVAREDGGFTVTTSGGARFRADAVALAIGHGPLSFPLPGSVIPAEARGRMIADPWTDPRMAAIESDARILFVGSSQTMADQAVGLDARGHRGPMVAVSRHGQLPATQLCRQTEPVVIALDRRFLRDLFRSVVASGKAEMDAGRDWRAVIDGLRPLSQELWEGLSLAERRRFIRHADAAWLTHRSRLAPAVGERIDALRAAGRLAIRAARLDGVVPIDGRLAARLKVRGSGRIEIDTFDWIVNCSGVGRLRPDAMEPLLARMLADGLVRIHSLGRGLDIEADHTAIDRSGAPVDGLYVLGPLAGGRFFESIAVPEIAVQSAKLAERLAGAPRRVAKG